MDKLNGRWNRGQMAGQMYGTGVWTLTLLLKGGELGVQGVRKKNTDRDNRFIGIVAKR